MSADTVEGAALVLAKLNLAPSNARRTKPPPVARTVPATQQTPAAIREPHTTQPANANANANAPSFYDAAGPPMQAWADRRARAEPIEWEGAALASAGGLRGEGAKTQGHGSAEPATRPVAPGGPANRKRAALESASSSGGSSR